MVFWIVFVLCDYIGQSEYFGFGFILYKSDFYDADLVVLHRYLEIDHIQHCVPSKVSSGLSFLPVSFVYVNGSANVTQKTTKVLPTGEPLNGAKAYIDILSYFTTTNNTPEEVHELGYTMLYKLFPEVRFKIGRASCRERV